MPTPQTVTSTTTDLPVWEVDNTGNTRQDGGIELKANPNPEPTPAGHLQLYSPDGVGLSVVLPNGAVTQVPIPDAAGSLDLVGATSTSKVLDVRIVGNAGPQLDILASGKIEWGDGSGPVSVNLFRDGSSRLHTTNDFATEGNLVADVAGKGLVIREGSNARMGQATLAAGTVTVANTSVTANTRPFLSRMAAGGTLGQLSVTVSAGVSFTITSSSGTETSTVNWLLIEKE
ncbi:MAG: hypothetical protein HOY76_18585 [Streptomyces sp.]|nr:hypothetical protein [Streptomyces sp.]